MSVKLTEREMDIIADAVKRRAERGELDGGDIESRVKDAVKRAENGEPIAYVIGEWYFYGLTFRLDRSCLIPRPDTEHTVEACISALPRGGRLLEPCTGSGCIAISVLAHRSDCACDAVEISEEACEMARLNARLNGVDDRINVVNADIFEYSPQKKYDVIASNPPYIRTDVIPTLDASVKDHEPLAALDGGEDGIRFYRYMLNEYRSALCDGGRFIFEIGFDQKEAIERLAASLGYCRCSVTKDYGGNWRVAVIEK